MPHRFRSVRSLQGRGSAKCPRFRASARRELRTRKGQSNELIFFCFICRTGSVACEVCKDIESVRGSAKFARFRASARRELRTRKGQLNEPIFLCFICRTGSQACEVCKGIEIVRGSAKFTRFRASARRELRTRNHRNEVTGQSPRHGASRMKQTVRTDACDFGATPPR